MDVSIKVIGSKIKCLVRGNLNGALAKHTRGITFRIKSMGLEKWFIRINRIMKVTGPLASSRITALWYKNQEK
jgi:hypothetical protein